MAKYIMLALNAPTKGEGDEDTYNEWYQDVHLPDLRKIDGVKSATRFKIEMSRNVDWPYVALYEIETDDTAQLMQDMATKTRPFTEAFDRETSGFVLARLIEE